MYSLVTFCCAGGRAVWRERLPDQGDSWTVASSGRWFTTKSEQATGGGTKGVWNHNGELLTISLSVISLTMVFCISTWWLTKILQEHWYCVWVHAHKYVNENN